MFSSVAVAFTLAACGLNPSSSSAAPAPTATHLNRAYVADGSGGVVPIDLKTNTAGTPIAIAGTGGPGFIAVSPDETTAYVTTPYSVTPIDLTTNTVVAPIPFPTGNQPVAIAITPDGKTAFVVGDFVGNFTIHDALGNVTPIDLATHNLKPPIAFAPGTMPTAIAITPDGKTAYVTDVAVFVGGLSVVVPIDVSSNSAGTTIPLPPDSSPVGIAITPDGRDAYVAVNCNGCVNVVIPISLTTNSTGTPMPFGAAADEFNGVMITPDGKTAYVTVSATSSGYIEPIDLATGTYGTPIPIGAYPWSLAIGPNGKTGYVVARQTAKDHTTIPGAVNSVVPFDLVSRTLGTPIISGTYPRFIVITP